MIRATDVEPREGYRIWLRYSDGAAGEVDLSNMAGRGVFKVWLDRAFFEGVHVSGHGSIAWSDDVELCEDALLHGADRQVRGRAVSGAEEAGRRCLSTARAAGSPRWSERRWKGRAPDAEDLQVAVEQNIEVR